MAALNVNGTSVVHLHETNVSRQPKFFEISKTQSIKLKLNANKDEMK